MHVREGMSEIVLTVGPGHSLREAAASMCARHVGAAVVLDPDAPGPGVITERDILRAVGRGEDPDTERVADHLTSDLTFAAPGWSLEHAAAAMVRGRFRHLVVVERGELVGILSMRDIVRCWTGDGASCEVPAGSKAPAGSEVPAGSQA
jgi:CBS domain-containing protein